MSRSAPRPAALPHSLHRLRLRLTAWYVGTFFAILLLLGIGMFAAITRRFDLDLDASLGDATRELVAAAHSPEGVPFGPAQVAADAIRDLRIPERSLYLTDTLGHALAGTPVEPWMAAVARTAWKQGSANASHTVAPDRTLRVHGERLTISTGEPLIALAAADEIELEDRYAALIAAFGATALVAVVLVAAGGWLLARQSSAPVERAIVHMRRFMADAAHELRTPLTVVRSRAEIALQQSRSPADYQTALRGIERESARLGRIVEDLLMLARADTGERPLERHRIFLDDVTLDAAEGARAMADRRAVRLEVDDFEEAPITGDADLLRQLVLILLDNAIKYTDAGGLVRVGVRATPAHAVLTVSDTGIGIPAEQLPHVFERFYRGDPSRTRIARDVGASEGAGLGLSIAQWIADEHGGTIRIESAAGQGTAVIVQFPRAGAPDVLSSP